MFPMLVRMGSDSSRKTFGFPEAQVFQKTAKSTVDQTDWPSASSVQMSQSWSRVSELVWNRASPKSGMRQGTEEEVERVFRRITTSWAGSVWHKHFCTMFSFVMNLSMNSRNAKKKNPLCLGPWASKYASCWGLYVVCGHELSICHLGGEG